MAKKKIKKFTEEKEEIIRTYSYPVIEEMFKKKYGYKIIDNLPPDEQEKIDNQFKQFLEYLGYGPTDDSIFDF